MIGILLAVAISWVLLYLVERKSITALGIFPIWKRLREFGSGFVITATLCFCVQFSESSIRSSKWLLNKEINESLIFKMFFWDLKSVITEELIFRGAILYILIKKLGVLKGTLISSVAFGIYHWFSFGILGDIIPMLVVFIGTGLMGYAWALAFSKTESMAMPIGLHFGWNFTFNTIFSNGPLGDGFLLLESDGIMPGWISLVGLWIVPMMVFLFVKFLVRDEKIEFVE
jgi:membrane protease YdiL (CAAX protease family)